MSVFVHNPYGWDSAVSDKGCGHGHHEHANEEDFDDRSSTGEYSTSSCGSLSSAELGSHYSSSSSSGAAAVTSSSELIAEGERHGLSTYASSSLSSSSFGGKQQPFIEHIISRRSVVRSEAPVICLDHLKGVCEKKRWKCKYVHPALPLAVSLGDHTGTLCAPFLLTGHCPRGGASGCPCVHSSTLPLPFLQSLASNTFDDCLQRIIQGLCAVPSPAEGRLPNVLLGLLATAAFEPALAPLSARLLASVVSVLSPHEQQGVAGYLGGLIADVLHAAAWASNGGNASRVLYSVQRGSVLFLGEALTHGLCTAPCTYPVMDVLLRSNNEYQRELAMDLLTRMSTTGSR